MEDKAVGTFLNKHVCLTNTDEAVAEAAQRSKAAEATQTSDSNARFMSVCCAGMDGYKDYKA